LATRQKQGDDGKGNSAVDTAANSLRDVALSKSDGDFLGSEDELVAKLGVSKPTLRQASAKVAQEHLIRVRRGVGGGYFARRPGSQSVSRMAAVYLQSRDASYIELINLVPLFYVELARLASENSDPAQMARLQELAEQDETIVDSLDDAGFFGFLMSERDFITYLAKIAGNNVLELMIEITADFSAHAQRNDEGMLRQLGNMAVYRKLRAKVARAIADGDGDIAGLLARRCSDLMCDWMQQGFENRSFKADQIEAD